MRKKVKGAIYSYMDIGTYAFIFVHIKIYSLIVTNSVYLFCIFMLLLMLYTYMYFEDLSSLDES